MAFNKDIVIAESGGTYAEQLLARHSCCSAVYIIKFC